MGDKERFQFVAAPMVLAGIGIALSIISIYFVKTEEGASQKNLLWALRRGVWGASGLIVVAALLVTLLMLNGINTASGSPIWPGIFGSIVTGLLAGVLIGWFTEYYTAAEYPPTLGLAEQTQTGPATTIIGGVALGMLSTWASLAIVGIGTLLAYGFAGGFTTPALGLYGVGFAAVGMLATLGITLATDAYGPIADNAGGNAQMTNQDPEVRERTDALDSLGNTTAATGKGFAIGSAALTALALLAAFVEEIRVGIQREATTFVTSNTDLAEGEIAPIGHGKYVEKAAAVDEETGFYKTYFVATEGATIHTVKNEAGGLEDKPLVRVKDASLANFMEFYKVNLMNPKVLVGMFMGVLMVFTFCGLTMKAVGRAAGRMVEEVRRQFRELKLLEDENAKADYTTCVSIATKGAQQEMIFPALLAVIAPIVVGLILNVAGIMGLLAGGLTAGFAVAIFMANAGGSWDNAKKHIEAGAYGGKGSDPHKAAVVGDTVGDPFKDTSGPSLNILIKLMSMVAVVFAGVIVAYAPVISKLLGLG